jgi:hypothetical protein
MKKPTRLKNLVLTTTTIRALDARNLADVDAGVPARGSTLLSARANEPLC